MPTLDQKKIEAIFAMFKGEPGTRKSTCALSFPTPIFWFDIDQKIDSVIIPAKKWGINLKDVTYENFTEWNTSNKAIEQKLESLQMNCPYRTIVLDSVTSMGDVVNQQTSRLKSGTTTKEGAEKGMRIGGITVNSLEDYKAEASAFTTLVSKLKDIHTHHKVNVIIVAHVVGERQQKDKGNITHFARIIITGGKTISGKIPAYCPEVYHFNVAPHPDVNKPPDYELFTVHTGDDFARTSLPLDTKISFGDKELYKNWIKPAMDKLNA